MKQGFWGNYELGEFFEIDEHEMWIRRWDNAARLGLAARVIARIAEFEPIRDRDRFLPFLYANAPVMRWHGHGESVTFDFDGVIADDNAERLFRQNGLDAFQNFESANGDTSIAPGPLCDLFRKLGNFRQLEDEREEKAPAYRRVLKTAIVTARSVPAHKRVVTTLRNWNITVDETHFLGGLNKRRMLAALRPCIYAIAAL